MVLESHEAYIWLLPLGHCPWYGHDGAIGDLRSSNWLWYEVGVLLDLSSL